jgi:predicted alpha/beta hydrolase
MTSQPITIPAAIDGYPLAALLLEPATPPRGVVQVHSGTGYKKEFYVKLATYLADQG